MELQKNLDNFAMPCIINSMERYLLQQIKDDLKKKMVFITGPRQVGKTTLAKQLMEGYLRPTYLNFDNWEERRIIQNQAWRQDTDLLVFDELHKMKGWKTFLKGVYDSRLPGQDFLITGSARLDTFRQSGESLAGRYFHFRLMPLSVKELGLVDPVLALEKLNLLGGFPEPCLSQSETEAQRWRNQYFTDLIREDIVDFSRLHEITTMRQLLDMLRGRVGSPLSYSTLAGDLQVSPNTVKKYVSILASLYIIFLIRPFSKKVSRSLLKEPKLYFFDTGFVKSDAGNRLENSCAVSLLKHVYYLNDTLGRRIELQYLKTNSGHEVDFALCEENKLLTAIEVKYGDNKLSRSLLHFKERVEGGQWIQLVHNLKNERSERGIDIVRAADWLKGLSA